MDPIQRQEQANNFLEGGIFYPTGHVVIGLPDSTSVDKATQALKNAGFEDQHLLGIDANTMVREATKNLAAANLSAGSALPTRQKQLELAEEGCHFLVIYAPEDADHERAIMALSGLPVRYAVKYRRLVIENLVENIRSNTADSEPARVP